MLVNAKDLDMFESSSDWSTREWIKRATINQIDWLKLK